MKIDEVIKREEETAEYYENIIKTRSLKDIGSIDEFYENDQVAIDVFLTVCKMCIEQSRQTIKWLKDYKRLLNVVKDIMAEINTSNRGVCDYYIVDKIEQIINNYAEDQNDISSCDQI